MMSLMRLSVGSDETHCRIAKVSERLMGSGSQTIRRRCEALVGASIGSVSSSSGGRAKVVVVTLFEISGGRHGEKRVVGVCWSRNRGLGKEGEGEAVQVMWGEIINTHSRRNLSRPFDMKHPLLPTEVVRRADLVTSQTPWAKISPRPLANAIFLEFRSQGIRDRCVCPCFANHSPH